MLVQLGDFPSDDNLNTVLSAAFYVGGTLVGGYGILQRSGLRLTSAFYILSFALIVGGVWYYCYIEPDLLSRVYVLNLGMATLILSFSHGKARRLFKGPLVDKLLLVMPVLVALQFVPRTLSDRPFPARRCRWRRFRNDCFLAMDGVFYRYRSGCHRLRLAGRCRLRSYRRTVA